MKRTLPVIELNTKGKDKWTMQSKITCEVTGEMEDGAKIWTDIATGKQYFMFKMLGTCYFSKF